MSIDQDLRRAPPQFSDPRLFVGILATHLCAQWLAHHLMFEASLASIRPGSGLLLAALLLCPYRQWLIIIAAILSSGLIADFLVFQRSLFLFHAGAELCTGFLGALLLRRLVGRQLDMGSGRETAALVLFGAILAGTLGASVGAAAEVMADADSAYWSLWQRWWFSDVLGVLMVTPLLLAIWGPVRPQVGLHGWMAVELGMLFTLLLVVGQLVFGGNPQASNSWFDFPYLLFPLLIWAALRFDSVIALLATIITCLQAAINGKLGLGPFITHSDDVYQQVLALQGYLGIALAGMVLFVAVLTRQRRSEQQLLKATEARRSAMESIHQRYWRYDKNLCLEVWNDGADDKIPVSGLERAGQPLFEELLYWTERGWHGAGDAHEIAEQRLQRYRDGTIPRYEQRSTEEGYILEIRRYRMPDGGYTETQADITEQVQMELQSRENEALFKAFLANTPSLITIKDNKGLYTHVSDQLYEFYQFERDQVIGHSPREIFSPEIANRIENGDAHCRQTGQVWHNEVSIDTASGPKKLNLVRFPVTDVHGSLIAIGSIAIDVTETRLHQNELLESEERNRLTLEAVGSGGWDYDVANGEIHVSERFMQLLGYEMGEVDTNAEWINAHAHPEDFAGVRDAYVDHVKGKTKIFEHELRGRLKSGEYKWFLVRGLAVNRDAEGRVTRLVGANFDIDDRKRAEAALQRSEIRYRNLFEQAPVALVEQDWSKGRQLVQALREQGIEDIEAHLKRHPDLASIRGDISDMRDVNQELLNIFGADDKQSFIRWAQNRPVDGFGLALIERIGEFALGQRRISFERTAHRMNGDAFPALITSELASQDPSDWSRVYTYIHDLSQEVEAQQKIRESDENFKRLFEAAPVALYEQDWSRGKALVDRLRAEGIEDIAEYLDSHPELIQQRSDVCEQLKTNQAALHMRGHSDEKAMKIWLNADRIDESQSDILIRIGLFASGQRRVSCEATSLRVSGEPFPVYLTSEIVGDDADDWSRVYTSEQDITAIKQTENALQQSEVKFRNLAEGSLQGFAVFDTNWKIEYVNPALARILGYAEPSVMLGTSWANCVSPQEMSRMQEYRDRRLLDDPEVPTQYETDLARADGSLMHALIGVRMIEWDQHRAFQYIVFDITEQKNIEIALHESNAQFKAFMDNTPDVIAIKDAEGRYSYVNRRFEQLYQVKGDDIRGEFPLSIASKNNPDKAKREDRRVRESLKPHKRSHHSSIDGREQHWLVTSFPITTAQDELVGTGEISTDVSKLKRIEIKLAESEKRYRRLFQTAPVSLWEQDWSGIKQLVDSLRAQGIENVIEHIQSHPDLIGRRTDVSELVDINAETLRLFAARNKQEFIEQIQNAYWLDSEWGLLDRIAGFLQGQRRVVTESRVTRMDGSAFPSRVTSEIANDDLQDWSRIYTTNQDITEEVESAERLADYRDELRSLAGKISLAEESERRRIASDLHDGTIQNLIVARMNISSLKKNLRAKKSLQLVDNINSLLENSLKETRTLIFDLSPPVLYELGLAAGIVWLTQQFEQRTGLSVDFQHDQSDLPLAHDLKVVLFQTIRELLVNVAKHAQATQVTIQWRHLDKALELSVIDDGIGFDIDKSGIKNSADGGFGLFSIRERLDLLGADFVMESSSQGTRVSIIAPLEAG